MDWTQSYSVWTLIFISVIAAMTVALHFLAYHQKVFDHGPSLLTSIGIFGTFLGIAMGLWHFDTHQLDNSVPLLIEGLKTSFWSSISGLLGALTLKFRSLLRDDDESAGVLELLKAMQRDQERTADALDLQGDHGYANLLRLHHSEIKRQLTDFQKGMQELEAKMADMNLKALEKTMGTMIQEFNQNVTEQYGDNFKYFNESIGHMLTWQENHKTQITQLIDDQQRVATTMCAATEAYREMVEHAQNFSHVSSSLGELLKVLSAQKENISEHLIKLAELVNSASQGLPRLEERIFFLTDGLASAIQQHQDQMLCLLQQTSIAFGDAVTEVTHQLQQTVLENQEIVDKRVVSLLNRHEKQLMHLDDALEHELNNALKTLGMQLTALSEKFVSDYTPLTQKLRDLLKAVEAIPYENSRLCLQSD